MSQPVWIINGIPGVGKSTVSRALCARFATAAHIEGDRVQDFIVSGSVQPGSPPVEEQQRQIHLNVRNQCLLAASFSDAGFTPIIDYVVTSRARLEEYRSGLCGHAVHLVTLDPGIEVALERDRWRVEKTVGDQWIHLREQIVSELGGIGLWLDTGDMSVDETVTKILNEAAVARVAG